MHSPFCKKFRKNHAIAGFIHDEVEDKNKNFKSKYMYVTMYAVILKYDCVT